jgi:hypothetical protein
VAVKNVDRVEPRRLPDVDGVWVAIGADSLIVAILFTGFMQARLRDPATFEASRHTLNANLGGIDTVTLLTSSALVVLVHDVGYALRWGLVSPTSLARVARHADRRPHKRQQAEPVVGCRGDGAPRCLGSGSDAR